MKACRRRTQGTGRMRYLKHMPRRAKNGMREGGSPPTPQFVNAASPLSSIGSRAKKQQPVAKKTKAKA
jgi:hypothetical protein